MCWTKKYYPGSPISLVPFSKGDEILTSEISGIEQWDTQTPKTLLLGGEWVNTQMGGEWVIHKSCTIPLCDTINKMRHGNGLAGKIFKFLSTSGLRSSFPLSDIWSLIQKSHSLIPSSLIMNFDCFQLWCWTSLLFPAFHFTLVLSVSFPWCYLGDD